MNKFRPQDISKRYIVKERLKTGRSENYNWQSRIRWYPAGWKYNQQILGRLFGRLHYLACHAPAPIQKQWSHAYKAFYKKHIPTKASVRYHNTYSSGRWL